MHEIFKTTGAEKKEEAPVFDVYFDFEPVNSDPILLF